MTTTTRTEVRPPANLKNSKLGNSPAINGRNYGYFHLNLRGRRLKTARARRHGDSPSLNLPFPRTCTPCRLRWSKSCGLAEDRIDTRRAGLILYMLQQASTNLNLTSGWEGQRKAVSPSRSQFREALRPPADPESTLSDLASPSGGGCRCRRSRGTGIG